MLGGAGEGRVAPRGPGCHSQRCKPTDCCLMPAAAVLQACRCVGESDLSHSSAFAPTGGLGPRRTWRPLASSC
eukprot:scaffold9635_cov74-Phaeocystis_antarctica.AAC.1